MNAADDLLLEWAAGTPARAGETVVVHDRFGALTLSLPAPVRLLSVFHSQEEALRMNAAPASAPPVSTVFDPLASVSRALLKVPKSLELWEVYLSILAAAAGPETVAAAGFMTRHFTPRMLEIAGRYAGGVSQSRAQRKARLLLLSDFRGAGGARVPIRSIGYAGREYRQYFGVFSASHIDYATQWLLEEWERCPELAGLRPGTLLDLACGNGVIGNELLRRYPEAFVTATDDSILAVESARLNLPADRSVVYFDHTLGAIADATQDLVVTNPPFHFGHENNIEVSLDLFRQARRVLRPGGHLVVVANRHLNYGTHLSRYFSEVLQPALNDKFVIYRCAR